MTISLRPLAVTMGAIGMVFTAAVGTTPAAHADMARDAHVDNAQRRSTSATCTARVASWTETVDKVTAKFVVSCNTTAFSISVGGVISRGSSYVEPARKLCFGVDECVQRVSMKNPSGTQGFMAAFDPESTFVAWPSHLPAGYVRDSGSADSCPQMGCRGWEITA